MQTPTLASQVVWDILRNIINEVTAPVLQTNRKPISQLIPYVYNKNYNIYQGKCYQQFSPNLCGYHAIFNTFCFLKMFDQNQSNFNIQTAESFWRFKTKVQKFLFKVKKLNKLADQWPWRPNDITEGDFQRTYNKICLQNFQQFSIFKKHQKFIFVTHTWSFQYSNLLLQRDKQKQLTKSFIEFQNYRGRKPMILHLMLGITTHWLTFLAVKNGQRVQYWFFDSFNDHYLDFSWKQIVEHIEKKNQQRIKYGRPPISKFHKQAYAMCKKDTQISLRLIIDCLEGRQTLQSYSYNQRFQLFANPLQAGIAADRQSAFIVIRQYKHNISTFFNESVQWNLLNIRNVNLMKFVIDFSVKQKRSGYEGRYFYSVIKGATSNFSCIPHQILGLF